MTVANVTTELPVPHTDRRIYVVTWTGLVNSDIGAAIEFPEAADRSIQFTGTFDTSTIVWEGSNDGTNYVTLTDPQGNSLSKTAAAIEQIVELTRYMRPRVTAGGAATAITATLLVCRR